MIVLGLDPGAKGAFAWTSGDFAHAQIVSLAGCDVSQTYLRLQAVVHQCPVNDIQRIAFLEENSGYIAGVPRTGSSMYKFGLRTGWLEMALVALKFDLRRVRPLKWQTRIAAPSRRPGEAPRSFKGRLCSFAREIAPQMNARITRDNADSVLILKYALESLR